MAKAPWPAFSADELVLMGKTVYVEARGEDAEGQRGVGHVILNRFRARPKYGADLAGVCWKESAFTGWNKDNPNRTRALRVTLSNSLILRACTLSALQAFDEYDFTQGSTHYHTKDIEEIPKWAFGHRPIYTHGRHVFYNDIT